jgi:hypothetical protein
MNENQHDACVAAERSRGRMNLAEAALEKAKLEWRGAMYELKLAVRADPESWYGTQGVVGLGLVTSVGPDDLAPRCPGGPG